MYPNKYTFEMYEEIHDLVPLYISVSDVELLARQLNGSVGTGGADSKVLRDWCTRFSYES